MLYTFIICYDLNPHMRYHQFILVFILGVSLVSCYEREEACLDELATNFTISADDACDECCTYPSVGFQISHFLGIDRWGPDSIITNDFGQEMKMRQSLVYLSDFKLYKTDGGTLEVGEESEYEDLDGNSITLKEDHILIDQNDNFMSIGTIRENGTIDSISCNIGIHHNYISLDENELLFKSDSLYESEQYFDMVFYLQIGPLLEDDISVRIRNVFDNKMDSESVTITEKLERTSLGLIMQIDYLEILKKINVEGIQDGAILEEVEIGDSFIKFKE